MEKIVLNYIEIKQNLVEYHFTYSEGLKSFFCTDCMFVEYEEDVSEVPISILTIPFVNCMAGFSWLSNCVLFVDEIDATYYESFKVLKVAYNELHHYIGLRGLFVPSRIVKNEIKVSDKGLLLFGGGVDCHSSFLRNKHKISHILNIYGWLKDIDEVNKVDISDKEKTAEYAKKMGVTALHVRSNFASQFNLDIIDKTYKKSLQTSYWYGFLHSMAFLAIATPLAWKYNLCSLYIASSFTKGRMDIKCTSYITTDSEYRFAVNGTTIHDGFELNRQDKVSLIVNYQKRTAKPYNMQVCSFNDYNCCKCEKCFRTIIGLVAENADPRNFGFNIGGSLRNHWEKVINRDVALWAPAKENHFYTYTASQMRENYEAIDDKEFVDWFLSLDFFSMKKKALKTYYRKNFWNILKRKLHLG